MRRAVAWGLALAGIVALAACGFMRWPLSAAKVGDSLNAAFGAPPRLHWSAPDAASFSALPWPSVRIANARLDDAYGVSLLSAPAARLNLSLIELLRGRFIPTGAVLVSPAITIDLDRPPFAGPAGGAPGPASVAGALAPLTSLSLSNGVLRLVSDRGRIDTVIDKVQGRVDGLTIGDQLRFNASAEWRNTPFTVAGALNDPEAAANGEASQLVFALDSPLVKLAFGGALALGDKPSAEGNLTASVPSISALAPFLDMRAPPGGGADDIAIAAKVTSGPHALALSDATLTSAGQTVEGALAIDVSGGRPAISGTLAAETLALRPLLGPPERIFDESGGWSAKPLPFDVLRSFDLDLRFSVARLDVYGLPLTDVAASVINTDGKLNMTLIEAGAYGGRVDGEAAVAWVGRDVKISAHGRLVDADLGAAIADFGQPVMTGSGRAQFALKASGPSLAVAIASLTGTASLEAANGSLLGVNLEQALRRAHSRPGDFDRDRRVGETAFDKLDVALALDKGRARIERGVMTSHGMTAELDGLVDLVGEAWALRLNAAQTDAAGEPSQDGARLAFKIAGPWSRPTIRPIGDDSIEPAGDPPSR